MSRTALSTAAIVIERLGRADLTDVQLLNGREQHKLTVHGVANLMRCSFSNICGPVHPGCNPSAECGTPLLIQDGGQVVIEDSTFDNNFISDRGGMGHAGGISVGRASTVDVRGTIFSNNQVTGSSYSCAGGIYVDGAEMVNVSDCSFVSNSATSCVASAIGVASSDAQIAALDSQNGNGNAPGYPMCDSSPFIIEHSQFSANTVEHNEYGTEEQAVVASCPDATDPYDSVSHGYHSGQRGPWGRAVGWTNDAATDTIISVPTMNTNSRRLQAQAPLSKIPDLQP